MNFAADYLAQLEAFAARGPLPRIRALHLPPNKRTEDNRGIFCAMELEDGSIGLSYVLLDDTLERLHDGSDGFGLPGADTLELARRYVHDKGIGKTLGFAAANAVSRCLFDRAGFRPDSSADSIGRLNPQPGEHVGMIGKFSPLLRRITDRGARLTVVELNPQLVGEHDGYRVTLLADACATRTQSWGDETVPARQVHAAFLAALGAVYATVLNTAQFIPTIQEQA